MWYRWKNTELGTTIGKLASMPVNVFATGDRKTRLWVHSWMITQSAWSANAPTSAPAATMTHQGLERRSQATATWNTTMPTVIQKVLVVLPIRPRISGWSCRIRFARPPCGIGAAGWKKSLPGIGLIVASVIPG